MITDPNRMIAPFTGWHSLESLGLPAVQPCYIWCCPCGGRDHEPRSPRVPNPEPIGAEPRTGPQPSHLVPVGTAPINRPPSGQTVDVGF